MFTFSIQIFLSRFHVEELQRQKEQTGGKNGENFFNLPS